MKLRLKRLNRQYNTTRSTIHDQTKKVKQNRRISKSNFQSNETKNKRTSSNKHTHTNRLFRKNKKERKTHTHTQQQKTALRHVKACIMNWTYANLK